MTQATFVGVLLIGLVAAGCATTTLSKSAPSARVGSAERIDAMVLGGSPTIRLTLDREYQVVETRPETSEGSRSELWTWVFAPRDGQSSAVLGVGIGGHPKTEQDIFRMYEGAVVKKIPGAVAGKAVEWWHYQDSEHLYSTCYTDLPDRAGIEHPIYIDLVANRPQRIASLEEGFSRIEVD